MSLLMGVIDPRVSVPLSSALPDLTANACFRFYAGGADQGDAGFDDPLGDARASGWLTVSAATGASVHVAGRRERNRIEAERNAEFAASKVNYNDAVGLL